MSYPIGTIGIVINDKKSMLDNTIEMCSGGQGGHAFCFVGKGMVFEMNMPKGAILKELGDYMVKHKTVLMAVPLFIGKPDSKAIAAQLKDMAKDNVKYDYRGILGQLLRLPKFINNKKRYYCSEAIAEVYEIVTGYRFMGLDSSIVTPHDMEYHVRSCQYDWELCFL